MTYQALYRKWRSQTFDELVGQEAAVRVLTQAVALNRVAHAYLFTGPRGTGKTSAARLFAKALNCEKGPTPAPCGQCALCQKIRDGACLDVIEIDAASNRGIDEIRELRERVHYVPVEGRTKIYIVDEVHMLTTEAFNALLKTLEEPPAHVVFILATTEIHRVPATIQSRCQRIDFRRIAQSHMGERIQNVAAAEGVTIEPAAVALIARAADGSMRDAISLLDQLISFCDKAIGAGDVAMMLGSGNPEWSRALFEAVIQKDRGRVLTLIDEVLADGASPSAVLKEISVQVRFIFLAHLPGNRLLDEIPAAEREAAQEIARSFSSEALQNVLSRLARAEAEVRWHPHPRVVLELAVLELLTAVSSGESSVIVSPASIPAKIIRTVSAKSEAPVPAPLSEDVTVLRSKWELIVTRLAEKNKFLAAAVGKSFPVEASGGKVVLRFRRGGTYAQMVVQTPAFTETLEDYLSEELGKSISIETVFVEESPDLSLTVSPDETPIQQAAAIFGGRVVG